MALSVNHSSASAKAAGKTRAKAKAKVKARARATAKVKQRVRTAAKNQRRGERRRCVQKLNGLAAEVGAARIHLDRRFPSAPEFDRAVRLLERRCNEATLNARLRDIAHE